MKGPRSTAMGGGSGGSGGSGQQRQTAQPNRAHNLAAPHSSCALHTVTSMIVSQAGACAAGRAPGAAARAAPRPEQRFYRTRRGPAVRMQARMGERQATASPPPPLLAEDSGSAKSDLPGPGMQQRQQQQQQEQAPLQPTQRGGQLAAAGAGLAVLGASVYSTLAAQPQLPPLSEVAGPAAAALLGGPLLALLAAKAVLRDELHLELHRCARWVGGRWCAFLARAASCCCTSL